MYCRTTVTLMTLQLLLLVNLLTLTETRTIAPIVDDKTWGGVITPRNIGDVSSHLDKGKADVM